MYKIIWDKEINGVILTDKPNNIGKRIEDNQEVGSEV